MVDYSINGRLYNGSNGDNILTKNKYNVSTKNVTIESNLHKFTSILFVLALIFGVCGMSFGMEKINTNLYITGGGNNNNFPMDNRNSDSNKDIISPEVLGQFKNLIEITKEVKEGGVKATLKYNIGKSLDFVGIKDGKIDGIQIVSKSFTDRVFLKEVFSVLDYYSLTCILENYKHNKVVEKENDKKNETAAYLVALVTIEGRDAIDKQYLLYCTNANSMVVLKEKNMKDVDGLFRGSSIQYVEVFCVGDDIKNIRNMFSSCTVLQKLNLSKFNTNNVTNMRYMFYNCTSLKDLNLSNWDTSAVTNMRYMFSGCSSLTSLNLSNFNTSKVTNMSYMFAKCSSLTNIKLSKFVTNAVKDMQAMFYKCSSLKSLNISKLDTENVTNMCQMFGGCNCLTELDLSSFKTHNVTDMRYMFWECDSLKDLNLSKFDTSSVKSCDHMFSAQMLTQDKILFNNIILPGLLIRKITNKGNVMNRNTKDGYFILHRSNGILSIEDNNIYTCTFQLSGYLVVLKEYQDESKK